MMGRDTIYQDSKTLTITDSEIKMALTTTFTRDCNLTGELLLRHCFHQHSVNFINQGFFCRSDKP